MAISGNGFWEVIHDLIFQRSSTRSPEIKSNMKPHLPESTWRKLRLEYQSTKTTCRELAEKYDVNRETVSNRCKVEKWRHGHQIEKRSPVPTGNQLVILSDPKNAQQQLFGRVFREANDWLERIQEAYQKEVRYDRIEAIQKLLPQWKTAVEQMRQLLQPSQSAAQKPSISLSFLSSGFIAPDYIESGDEFCLRDS